MNIILTVSNNAANIVGQLSKRAVAMLHQAEYSVVRQEGDRGYTTHALTVPLLPETGLTWQTAGIGIGAFLPKRTAFA